MNTDTPTEEIKETTIDGVRVVYAQPPILQYILDNGLQPSPTTIFAYSGAIYAPWVRDIRPDLIEHEKTHIRQQGDDPDAWWVRYVEDAYFRLDQEVEAYAAQYRFIVRNIRMDRNRQSLVLRDFATMLSGPIYGNMIGSQAAMKMIKSKANI